MSTITVKDSQFASYATVLLRIGLGVGFLSAVADRLGLWGAFGQPNVEWGNFSRFLEYTHILNWYLPAGMIPPLGVMATGAEILFGLLLLAGWHTRAAALLSGFLLLTFGVAMVRRNSNSSTLNGKLSQFARSKAPPIPVRTAKFRGALTPNASVRRFSEV